MRGVSAVVSFDEGAVTIGEGRTTEWKAGWKKIEKDIERGSEKKQTTKF